MLSRKERFQFLLFLETDQTHRMLFRFKLLIAVDTSKCVIEILFDGKSLSMVVRLLTSSCTIFIHCSSYNRLLLGSAKFSKCVFTSSVESVEMVDLDSPCFHINE